MRGGVLLIVVGLLLAYIGVTGRYKCFTVAFSCLLGEADECGCDKATDHLGEDVSLLGGFSQITPLTPLRPLGAGIRS